MAFLWPEVEGIRSIRNIELGWEPPHLWRLRRGFSFVDRQGVSYDVPAGLLTDLTSVPAVLWGLVSSHGRQAPAALLHDHLSKGVTTPARAGQVDDLFREALTDESLVADGHDLRVAPARAWVMWAAVAYPRLWLQRFTQPVAITTAVGALALITVLPALGSLLFGWLHMFWAAVMLGGGAALLLFAAALSAWSAHLGRRAGTAPQPNEPTSPAPLTEATSGELGEPISGASRQAGSTLDRLVRLVITGCAALGTVALVPALLRISADIAVPGVVSIVALITGVAAIALLVWATGRLIDAWVPVISALVGPLALAVGALTLLAQVLVWGPDVVSRLGLPPNAPPAPPPPPQPTILPM